MIGRTPVARGSWVLVLGGPGSRPSRRLGHAFSANQCTPVFRPAGTAQPRDARINGSAGPDDCRTIRRTDRERAHRGSNVYRPAADAAAAPPEELAYVVAFDRAAQRRDAMSVIDVTPTSDAYGQVVGWTDVAGVGRAAPLRLERLQQRTQA